MPPVGGAAEQCAAAVAVERRAGNRVREVVLRHRVVDVVDRVLQLVRRDLAQRVELAGVRVHGVGERVGERFRIGDVRLFHGRGGAGQAIECGAGLLRTVAASNFLLRRHHPRMPRGRGPQEADREEQGEPAHDRVTVATNRPGAANRVRATMPVSGGDRAPIV